MKVKSIIAALLLIVAGLQTAWAQKVVLYKTSGQSIECDISELDSIVFVDKEARLVTGIELSETTITLLPNETKPLAATVLPENADNKEIIWESSNEGVATIDQEGNVTAVAAGSCTVTATATDGSGVKAQCTVKVIQLVTSINLSQTSITLTSGTTQALTAAIQPDNATNKSVTWSSNDESVATVDQEGNVTAVAAGSCTITCAATDGSGVKAECTITVIQLVTSITLSETSLTLKPNETKGLTATVLPEDADNKDIVWESSDRSIATVDQEGNVTAVAAGSCTITVTSTDGSGLKAECQVIVKENGGGTIVANPLDGYEWVDLGLPSGTLWAKCNIGASSPETYGNYYAWGETQSKYDEEEEECDYSWSTYKYGTENNITKYNAADGKTELEPEDDAATVNWSSNWQMPSATQFEELINSIYTTSTWTKQNGKKGFLITSNINRNSIFLPAAGFCYDSKEVYGRNYDGLYLSRTLTTNNKLEADVLQFNSTTYQISVSANYRYCGMSVRPVVKGTKPTGLVTHIVLSETSLILEINETRILIATVLPENAENPTVTWESSNEAVAKVDARGSVTAKCNGTCVITCRATDGSGIKTECKVTVVGGSAQGSITNPLDGYEWVDLGLPSFTLWATCNIGANRPEDNGSFFAWGETETKNRYDESSYKYVLPEGQTELEPTADAATVNWSSNWQMPSAEQMDELLNSQYTTVEKKYDDDEHFIGYQITSVSNGNSIILPMTGFYYESKHYDAGGFFWSRSVGTEDNYGYCMMCNDNSVYANSHWMIRSYGATVRPVVNGIYRLVRQIELSKTTLSLKENDTWTLTATAFPENADNKEVKWESSKPSVATVDQTGKVTAVAAGSCTITCSAIDGSGIKAECQVAVVIDERLSDVIPPSIREHIGDNIPIYDGVTPPNIEGTYYIEPNVLIASTFSNDLELNLIGKDNIFTEYYHKYSNQDITTNTIDIIYVSESETSWGKSNGAFVCGSGNNFTIFCDVVGENSGVSIKQIYIISGTKTSTGIQRLTYGFYLKEKGPDPDNIVVPVGTYRFFNDSDGMSESTSWPFGEQYDARRRVKKNSVNNLLDINSVR